MRGESVSQTQVYVAEDVLLDARLALFHKSERWLAIADLHFGFELSQRVAGRLVPFWGMESVQERLAGLLSDFRPVRLILLGDLVHDHAAAAPIRELLDLIRRTCEVIAIGGNHDRRLRRHLALHDSFETEHFYFHHGDCERPCARKISVVGHFHPAATLRDGAGLRLKFPAFVQENNCWIMPAFSPWAAGTEWWAREERSIWLCSPRRILHLAPQPPLSAVGAGYDRR